MIHILLLLLCSLGFADSHQALEFALEYLPQTGILQQDETGFVYIDIDDAYIHALIPFLKEEGFEKPPYFERANGHGAHISVIYANEGITSELEERGSLIAFQIKECQIVHPPQWPDFEFLLITLECPILDAIRQKYGLPPTKYAYHITIGIK